MCEWKIYKYLSKMDKPKRIRAQGNSGCCKKQIREDIPKREEIPIKEKNYFKTFCSRRNYYGGICRN